MKLYPSNARLLKRVGIGTALLVLLCAVLTVNTSAMRVNSQTLAIHEIDYFQNYTLKGLHGESLSPEAIRSYKLIVLNGWGPWCPSCVAEMPDLDILAEEYKPQGVLLAGIVADYMTPDKQKNPDYDDQIDQILTSLDIHYPSFVADEEFHRVLYPTMYYAFPTTWAIDGNGRIIGLVSGGHSIDQWRETIDEWLKEAE